MENTTETYCLGCGSILKQTGIDPLSEETFFVCPVCSMEYTITETDDYTIVAEIDTTK